MNVFFDVDDTISSFDDDDELASVYSVISDFAAGGHAVHRRWRPARSLETAT